MTAQSAAACWHNVTKHSAINRSIAAAAILERRVASVPAVLCSSSKYDEAMGFFEAQPQGFSQHHRLHCVDCKRLLTIEDDEHAAEPIIQIKLASCELETEHR